MSQAFDYHGYVAPTMHFQAPAERQPRTQELGDPVVHQTLEFAETIAQRVTWTGRLSLTAAGSLNAVRFITKNLLAILPAEGRSIDWLMNHLIVPLASAVQVSAGDTVEVTFDYELGGPLNSLRPTARLV